MPSVVLGLLMIGVAIYALVDCLRSRGDEVRGVPRAAWVAVILLVPLLGGIAYLVYGRPRLPVAAGRMIAPDDDPEFLRSLDLRRRPGRGRKDGKGDGPKNGGGPGGPTDDGEGTPGPPPA